MAPWSTANLSAIHILPTHGSLPWIFAATAMWYPVCLATLVVAVALQGDPTCWLGEITYETCCLPPPHGNPQCWDTTYTFQRCCREVEAAVDINAVEEISDLGGCELNIFQEFKLRAGAWYRNGTPNLVLFQEFGYISRRFDSMYRTGCSCAKIWGVELQIRLDTPNNKLCITRSQHPIILLGTTNLDPAPTLPTENSHFHVCVDLGKLPKISRVSSLYV